MYVIKLVSFLTLSIYPCFFLYGASTSREVDDLTKSISTISISSSIVIRSPQHHVLFRNTTSLPYLYAKAYQGSEGFLFNLNREPVRERIMSTWADCTADGWKNHMYAGAVILYETHSEGVSEPKYKYRPFTTEMFGDLFHDHLFEEDRLQVDWVSLRSELAHSATLYRRRPFPGLPRENDAHSEPLWINDYKALWHKDHPSMVRKFMPPHGTVKVLMSGIELNSSFDACDACFKDLIDFKEGEEGQKSLSQAIKDELTRRRVPHTTNQKDLGLLFFHSAMPYHTASYGACERVSKAVKSILKYEYIGSKRFEPKDERFFEVGDTLSHVECAIDASNNIYSYIHFLPDPIPYKKDEFKSFRI